MVTEHTSPSTPQGATGGGGEAQEPGGVTEKVQQKGEQAKERATRMAEERKAQVAGKIEQVSERLEERARSLEAQGGMKARAGQAMERASDVAESGARYLRTHGAQDMRSDLETQIRERPLASVAFALGAGYVIGRMLG